jgi:hypothetical protein
MQERRTKQVLSERDQVLDEARRAERIVERGHG